ncbi:MAG: hypothetical protein WC548_02100 [Candidatus Pacearchaeota archaeon]
MTNELEQQIREINERYNQKQSCITQKAMKMMLNIHYAIGTAMLYDFGTRLYYGNRDEGKFALYFVLGGLLYEGLRLIGFEYGKKILVKQRQSELSQLEQSANSEDVK